MTVQLGIDTTSTFDHSLALTLTELAASGLIPGRRPRDRPNVAVLRRWCRKGCPLRGGARLVLPSLLLGGVRLVMPDWARAFQRMRGRLGCADPAPAGRTARQGAAAHRRAVESLRRQGFRVGG